MLDRKTDELRRNGEASLHIPLLCDANTGIAVALGDMGTWRTVDGTTVPCVLWIQAGRCTRRCALSML